MHAAILTTGCGSNMHLVMQSTYTLRHSSYLESQELYLLSVQQLMLLIYFSSELVSFNIMGIIFSRYGLSSDVDPPETAPSANMIASLCKQLLRLPLGLM